MRRAVAVVVGLAVALLAVTCVAAVRWYLVDVLIGLRGESDRSMQFWGLPILFLGIVSGIAAVGLAVVARRLVVRGRPDA